MRKVAPRALLCHTPLERSLRNQRLSKLATPKTMITSRETPIFITEIMGNPRADSNPVPLCSRNRQASGRLEFALGRAGPLELCPAGHQVADLAIVQQPVSPPVPLFPALKMWE